MNSPILDALCLSHNPRWIQYTCVSEEGLDIVHVICSNCGHSLSCDEKDVPSICPECNERMEDQI